MTFQLALAPEVRDTLTDLPDRRSGQRRAHDLQLAAFRLQVHPQRFERADSSHGDVLSEDFRTEHR